jgi:adenine/guanine phosphoribosyltransferase-like PRPP-binding protein
VTYIPDARPRRRIAPPRHADGNPELERRLAQEKAARAHRQSRIRALLSRRNEAVAAAVAGGVPAAAVAAATGLKITEVKKTGKAFAESYVPDLSREQHVAGLAALAEQLQAVIAEKESAERQLRADVVDVLRSGEMDVFRIAALTAVTADRLRELTRGTGLRAEAFGLGS